MKGCYSKFFHLNENPFGETPDPDYFYASVQHSRALTSLDTALREGKGFCVLTGEVGTGKTLLSRLLMSNVSNFANTALVLYPKFSEMELLQSICEDFEVPVVNGPQTSKAYVDQLNKYLLKTIDAEKRSVLIIDEAQALSTEALETVRLLTNLETKSKKLLQIVLMAQPELLATLNQPNLRQLKQRIGIQTEIHGLDEVETEKYIRSRIEQSGSGNFVRLDVKTTKVIHELSGGIPRRINQICEKLLQEAERHQIRLIDPNFTKKVLNIKPPPGLLSKFKL